MFILKYKYEVLLKVVVHVIVFIGILSMALKVQTQQSNFDNSINTVHFSRKLAYDSNHELKEYVDKNYVQQIIWKTHPLLGYPESISSRIMFKREANQSRKLPTRPKYLWSKNARSSNWLGRWESGC